MHHQLTLVALCVGLLCAPLAGQEFVLQESTPDEQLAIYEEIAAKALYSCYATDDAGNIVYLGLSHNKYARSSRPDDQVVDNRKQEPEPAGIRDEDFHQLVHFPKLQYLTCQSLRLTDAGYAVLQAFPDLKAIALTNLRSGWPEDYDGPRPTNALCASLDNARGLRYWDTTHSFGFQEHDNVLHEMQGFPELRYLNVDRGHSSDFDELFPFIQKSPQLRHIKLHRCSLSEDQLVQILDALPSLERLDLKPSGNEPGERWSYRSLRLLKNYPNLKYLRLIHGDALPLPWEDGLEHLVEATNITHIEFPLSKKRGPAIEDLRKLQKARPDLGIINLPKELLPEGTSQRDHKNALRDEIEIEIVPYRMSIGPG